MVAVTPTKSTVLSPHLGVVELVIEIPTGSNGKTLDVTTLDGGQGISTILAAFESAAAAAAIQGAGWSGTTVTVVGSGVLTLVVIGR